MRLLLGSSRANSAAACSKTTQGPDCPGPFRISGVARTGLWRGAGISNSAGLGTKSSGETAHVLSNGICHQRYDRNLRGWLLHRLVKLYDPVMQPEAFLDQTAQTIWRSPKPLMWEGRPMALSLRR